MRRGVYNNPTDPSTIEKYLSNEHGLTATVERAEDLDMDLDHLDITQSYTVNTEASEDGVDVAIDLKGDITQAVFNYEDSGKIITGVYRSSIPEVVGDAAVEYFTSDL